MPVTPESDPQRPRRSSSLRRLIAKVRVPSLPSFAGPRLPGPTSPNTAADILADAPEAAGGSPLPGVSWSNLASERRAIAMLRSHLATHCDALSALQADASALARQMQGPEEFKLDHVAADKLQQHCIKPLDALLADIDAVVQLGHARADMLSAIAHYEHDVVSKTESESSGSDVALRLAVNKYCVLERDTQRPIENVVEQFSEQAIADKRRVVDLVLATWQTLEQNAQQNINHSEPAPLQTAPKKSAFVESPVSSVQTLDDWSLDASFGLCGPAEFDEEAHTGFTEDRDENALHRAEVRVVFERDGSALDDLKTASDRASEGLTNLVTLKF